MSNIKSTGVVTKANILNEASYKLTALEQKVVLTLASMIQKDDSDLKLYTLSIKDFSNLIGVTSNSKYSELREITLGLMKKAFEIDLGDKIIQTSWLSFVSYSNGNIELQFAPFLKPFMLVLKKNFTTYRLANVARLKHSYSIRLYELLKQYQKIGERTFTLEELLKTLALSDSTYQLYGNFKLRVLKPAQKELAKKTDISFEIEEIKTGRKVTSIRFIIQKTNVKIPGTEEISALAFDKEDSLTVRDYLNAHNLSVSDEVIEGWLKYGIERVLEVLNYAVNESEIHNPIGFAVYAFKNNLTIDNIKTTVKNATAATRQEMIPDWLHQQKSESEEVVHTAEDDAKLEEDRKRLQETLSKYKRTS
ncbi:replication initiation protein [Bacillus luti]|nr:replication protein RepA [Bacillus cereus]